MSKIYERNLSPTAARTSGRTLDYAAPVYDLSSGSLEFTIRAREDGLRIDAFVLSTDDSMTASELDAAFVPEPTSPLLLGALLSLGLIRRRRK